MLPTIFILYRYRHLQDIVQDSGFQGDFSSSDLWGWLNETAEGFGRIWESNWMKVWEKICDRLLQGAREVGEDWAK